MNPFILLILGLCLIFLEFYLPGAVLGILGAILLIISIVYFAIQSNSPLLVAAYVIAIFIIVGFLIKFALWKIQHTHSRFNIYSGADQEGFQASTFDQSAIGKIGIVLSDLKPGGYISIDGKQHQALSNSGYIVKGSHVKVIGGKEESLIVKHIKKDSKT